MQFIKWFMLVALIWFVPTFASAQVCEERGLLTACSQFTANGSRFYIVTPKRGALFGELMAFVNEGVDERLLTTAQQIDDANPGKVIYYCPGTDLCTHGFCRNGVNQVVNGDDVPRHFETVCDGTQATASRGLVARNSYRVPAHRALTSTELVADATTTLDNNAHPLSGDVGRALGIGIEAGSDPVHAPSTLALAGLMRSVLNAQSRQVTVATVEAPAPTSHEPSPVVVSASAEATARILRLESELVLERKLSASRQVVLWCMIGLLFIAIIALIWQDAAQKKKVFGLSEKQLEGARQALRAVWEQKVAEVQHELDTLRARPRESLTKLAPVIIKDEMREAWTTTPKFSLQYTVANLEKVLAGWLRLDDVEKDVERLSAELDQERAKPSGDSVLLKPIEQIREQVYAMWREEFGSILSFSEEEHRRIVDATKVKDRFSSKGSYTGRGRNPKRTEFHDLRADSLTKFLGGVHRGLGHALDTIDRMLGHRFEEPSPDEGEAAEQPLAGEPTQIVANPFTKARDDEQTTRVVTRSTAAPDPEQGEVALRPEHFGARGEPVDD